MSNQPDSTPAAASAPVPASQLVSLSVPSDHPLLQLKAALDWPALTTVMTDHWRQHGKNVAAGPGQAWPVSFYVPCLVLMAVLGLKARPMEAYLNENVVGRVFLDLAHDPTPHVRDHASLARAVQALGATGWQAVTELTVREAVRLEFGRPEILASDTTVQEPLIGYPNEPGLLRGAAQRCHRALKKLGQRGVAGAAAVIEQVKEIYRTVKEHHLFAKTKAVKRALLTELVAQTEQLLRATTAVVAQVGATSDRVCQAAVRTLTRVTGVVRQLVPQIRHWLQTGKVAGQKIVHVGLDQARAIVKGKAGKRVEFGVKWLINRLGGGYVFGQVVAPYADERKMPLLALEQYRTVFGPAATPELQVYDRGGHSGPTVRALQQAGVAKVGVVPSGKAAWSVAAADQREVMSQRGQTEGSIGTLKHERYGFSRCRERSHETLTAKGQRAMAGLNLTKLLRAVSQPAKPAAKAAVVV